MIETSMDSSTVACNPDVVGTHALPQLNRVFVGLRTNTRRATEPVALQHGFPLL